MINNKEITNLMNDYLSGVKIYSPRQFRNMIVVPLQFPLPQADYLLSKEAYAKKLIEITEKSEAGSVPEIKVTNKAGKPVLFLIGESLKGAKQNRTLNISILVPPESEIFIPVSCTEQGRWRYNKKDFEPDRHFSPFGLRKRLEKTSKMAFKHNRRYFSDQQEVWKMVHEYEDSYGFKSGTSSLQDVMNKKAGLIKDFVKEFPYQAGQNAVIVFIDGKLEGLEFLDSPAKFEQLYEQIIKSFAFEANKRLMTEKDNLYNLNDYEIQYNRGNVRSVVNNFLKDLISFQKFMEMSTGLGENLNLEGNLYSGNILVFKENFIHGIIYFDEGSSRNFFRRRFR